MERPDEEFAFAINSENTIVLSTEDDDISNFNDCDELCDKDLDADELDLIENEGGNCALNRRYKALLQELRKVIISDLQRCRNRQAVIESRIQELDTPTEKPPPRKNWYNLFGYPYFKDRHFFPCPVNEDHMEKRLKHEVDYHQLPPIRRWVDSDCSKLEAAVKANAIEMKTSELMRQQGIVLQNLRNPGIKKDEKKNLSKKLMSINHEIESVKSMSPAVLFGDINRSFDWLKITAEAFGEIRSSEEVQAMWVLCRHPSINRRHWTNEENELLKEVARRNREQDWAKIAAELNNNRSQFQCVIQYQRHVNTQLLNHKWTDEEDGLLKFMVEECRIGEIIPWSTVTMCMKNRTRAQVYNRWQNSVNPDIKKGRFTMEEDCLIIAGVKRFGTDFTRIAALLPGRTSTQLYARYNQCLVRNGPLGRWSREEDAQLVKLVEEDGFKKWHELTKFFKDRSRNQIRHRYRFLKAWRIKNPYGLIEDAPRRDLGDYSKRNLILWSKIHRALESSQKEKKIQGLVPNIVPNVVSNRELNDDDLAVLKTTMSPHPSKARSRNVKKQKPLSRADQLLDEFGRVSYLLNSGRRKVLFDDREKQQRFDITMKILQAVQARLSFPYDESLFEEEESWNAADLFILLELKKKYDERVNAKDTLPMEVTPEGSSSVQYLVSDEHGGNGVVQTLASQNVLPLHIPGMEFSFSFPEVFPSNFGNIVGFRTLLISRNSLRMWKATPKRKVIAVPPWRPPSQTSDGKFVELLTKEESSKLFAERLFTLFKWPSYLARIHPSLLGDNCEVEEEEEETVVVTQVERPKAKRKRTIQHAAKAKKRMMKKRWMERKEGKKGDGNEDESALMAIAD